MPAAENMPSGTSYRPGDVIGSRKGLTIEIMNTDAEGRLLLADGLDYANVFNPQAVLDIATLTGAATYILGYAGAPILSNNKKFIDRYIELSSDEEALKVAFTEVLSGRAPEARGNGLKFVKNIVMQNDIDLFFQTGQAELNLKKGDTPLNIQRTDSRIQGCLAWIKF